MKYFHNSLIQVENKDSKVLRNRQGLSDLGTDDLMDESLDILRESADPELRH